MPITPNEPVTHQSLELNLQELNDTRTEYLFYHLVRIAKEENIEFKYGKDKWNLVLQKGDKLVFLEDMNSKVVISADKVSPASDKFRAVLVSFHPPFTKERVEFWFRDKIAPELGIKLNRILAENL
jgi:hypothetical protein